MVRGTFKSLVRVTVVGISVFVVSMVICIGTALMFARTDIGRLALSALIEQSLEGYVAESVTIDGLDGDWLSDFSIRRIVLEEDGAGIAELTNVRVDWSPSALIGLDIAVDGLAIEQVTLSGARASDDGPSFSPWDVPSPSLPLDIAIGRFEITRLFLGPIISESPTTWRIEGHGVAGRSVQDIAIRLDAERVDGSEGEILLDFAQLGEPSRLKLEISVREPSGGLITDVLGIPGRPPLVATLTGAGPTSDWIGRLSIGLGAATIQSDVHVAITDTLSVALSGVGIPAMQDGTASSPWAFSIASAWTPGEGLEVDSISLSRTGLSVEGSATLGEGEPAIDATVSVLLDDHEGWPPWLPGITADSVAGTVTANGSLRALGITIRATAVRPLLDAVPEVAELMAPESTLEAALVVDTTLGEAKVERLLFASDHARIAANGSVGDFGRDIVLDVEGTVDPPNSLDLGIQGSFGFQSQVMGDLTTMELMVPFAAQAVGLKTSIQEINTVLGPRLRAEGTVELGAEGISMNAVRIETGSVVAVLDGTLNVGSGSFTATVVGDLPDLTRPWAAANLAGNVSADATLLGRLSPLSVEASVSFGADLPHVADNVLDAVVGGRVEGDFEARFAEGGALEIAHGVVRARHGAIVFEGRLGESLDLAFAGNLPDLAVLGPPLGLTLIGSATMAGRLAGAWSDPHVDGQFELPTFSVEHTRFDGVMGTLRITGLTRVPAIAMSLGAEGPLGTFRLSGDFQFPDDTRIVVQRATVEGQGLRLNAEGTLTADGAATGRITARFDELGPLGKSLGYDVHGALDLSLAGHIEAGRQFLDGKIVAGDFGVLVGEGDPVVADRIVVEGGAEDVFGAMTLNVKADAFGATAWGLMLDRVSMTADGPLSSLEITASAVDVSERSVALELAGMVSHGDHGDTMNIRRLDTRWRSLAASLTQPLVVTLSEGSLIVAPFAAVVGEGRLTGQGAMDQTAVRVEAEIENLSASDLSGLVSDTGMLGTLSARLAIDGTLANPVATLKATAHDVAPADAVDTQLTISATLDAKYGNEVLTTDIVLVGSGGDARASAQSTLPAHFSMSPFTFSVRADSAISGNVDAEVDLAVLPRAFDLYGDLLEGRLEAHLEMAGTYNAPAITGEASLSDGRFESARFGTVIERLEGRAVGIGADIVLERLAADDGNGGTMSAVGRWSVGGPQDVDYRLDFATDHFRVLRRADAIVITSVNMTLERSEEKDLLIGNMTVDQSELRVPEELPTHVVSLDVTEINSPPERITSPNRKRNVPIDVALDLTIGLPGKSFLRGRGIDSEWRGNLYVGGTSTAPAISGELSAVQGRIDALGHVFDLQEGRVIFQDDAELDPTIIIDAVTETPETTARVRVEGRTSSPIVKLTSDPPLPQDEILSRLLFGESIGSLTPLQSVKLARSAADLAGASRPDILGMLRRSFGIDMLDVQASSEGDEGSTLRAGKYVTDRVFLRVEQSLTQENRRVGAEIEVLPQVTVEGDVGAHGDRRIGVNWHYDY